MGRDTHTGGRPATNGVIVGDFALSVGKPEKECPSGWAWVSLSEVARLETGHTPSRKHPEYWDGNIPWIGIKDATANHGRIIYNTYQHITALGIENSSARLLPANTVCLSRTASVGYVVVMGRPMATSQDFVNWVCGQELDYLYLKYILMLEKSALLRFASGTTHQTVYFPEAKAFHVCLPPLPTQKAIAHILGILDDKIELLREMNQTLEAMTRALFKSWFIDFDPVRKKSEGEPSGLPPEIDRLFPDSFQDSELGEIPKGWSITCLGDVITIYDSRRIPLSSMEREKKQGNYPYYGATSIMDYVDEYLFDGIFVLLGEDGSVAKEDGTPFTQYVWGKFWVNNHAHVLRGNSISNEHLFIFLTQTNVSAFSTGAVQAKLNQENMKKIPFLFATQKINNAFACEIEKLYELYRNNDDERRILTKARDSLLPKLISGELEVKEIGKILEQAK